MQCIFSVLVTVGADRGAGEVRGSQLEGAVRDRAPAAALGAGAFLRPHAAPSWKEELNLQVPGKKEKCWPQA